MKDSCESGNELPRSLKDSVLTWRGTVSFSRRTVLRGVAY